MTTNRLTIDLDLSQLFYGSEIHGDDEIPTPLLTGIVKEIAQHYMREIGMDLKREAENALKQAIYMSEAMKQAKAEVIGAVKAKGAGVSITIYNRSGSPLYTAETATTIREAVDAAVARGADLRGADLRGAYLSGADLSGAYLRDANLHGAYLRDTDLRGAYLTDAYLSDANLRDANLRDADLTGADLRDADLRGAYLTDADLTGADLRDADLRGAYLRDANLHGAKGVQPERISPLHLYRYQLPGVEMVAFKLVNERGEGPFNGGIVYIPGETANVAEANADAAEDCGAGINVATLDWCLKEWLKGDRILRVAFTAEDIAAIPTATDGKFRLHRCRVVDEIDLAPLGLVKTEAAP